LIAVFLVAGVSFAFLYQPIQKLYYHRHPKEYFYRKIMSVVKAHDFYLINNLKVRVPGGKDSLIDHLIGGEKYIYALSDCYCEGALTALPSDRRWVYYRKDGKKEEIPSPVFTMHESLTRLSMQAHIEANCLIGIVLINDDCFMNAYQNTNQDVVLVPRSRLAKVIDFYESQSLAPFPPETLRQFIHDIHELNQAEGEE